MAGVAFLCTVLDDLPKVLDGGGASETVPSESSSEPSPYQPGSWIEDDAL
jgi:hypothetical protein